jgi:hypothetical protein
MTGRKPTAEPEPARSDTRISSGTRWSSPRRRSDEDRSSHRSVLDLRESRRSQRLGTRSRAASGPSMRDLAAKRKRAEMRAGITEALVAGAVERAAKLSRKATRRVLPAIYTDYSGRAPLTVNFVTDSARQLPPGWQWVGVESRHEDRGGRVGQCHLPVVLVNAHAAAVGVVDSALASPSRIRWSAPAVRATASRPSAGPALRW